MGHLVYPTLEVHRLGFNAPGMITDTHENNIYAQKLNRNRKFFNRCTFSQRLAFNMGSKVFHRNKDPKAIVDLVHFPPCNLAYFAS